MHWTFICQKNYMLFLTSWYHLMSLKNALFDHPGRLSSAPENACLPSRNDYLRRSDHIHAQDARWIDIDIDFFNHNHWLLAPHPTLTRYRLPSIVLLLIGKRPTKGSDEYFFHNNQTKGYWAALFFRDNEHLKVLRGQLIFPGKCAKLCSQNINFLISKRF